METINALIDSVKYKMDDLKDMEKVFDFHINLYDDTDVKLVFHHLYKKKWDKIFELREKRIQQDTFRNNIIKRDKCCVLSSAPFDMCQAAHIIPHCESDTWLRYNIDNGILLGSGIHSLFDKYSWSINQECVVVVSNKLLNDKIYKYHINKYHGKKLSLSEMQLKNLESHYAQFMIMNC